MNKEHEYIPDDTVERPPGKLKWHQPCKVCGASKRAKCHVSVSEGNLITECPTCKGTGTLILTPEMIMKALS